eukprot:g16167.t1
MALRVVQISGQVVLTLEPPSSPEPPASDSIRELLRRVEEAIGVSRYRMRLLRPGITEYREDVVLCAVALVMSAGAGSGVEELNTQTRQMGLPGRTTDQLTPVQPPLA